MPIVEIRLDGKNQSATSGVIVADSITSNAKVKDQPFISVHDSKALIAANEALVYLRTTGAVRYWIPTTWDDYQKASKELIAQGATIQQRALRDYTDPDVISNPETRSFGVVRWNDTVLLTPRPMSELVKRYGIESDDFNFIPPEFGMRIRTLDDVIKGVAMPLTDEGSSVRRALPDEFLWENSAAALKLLQNARRLAANDNFESAEIIQFPGTFRPGEFAARNIMDDIGLLARLLNLPYEVARRLLAQLADKILLRDINAPGSAFVGKVPNWFGWTNLCFSGPGAEFRHTAFVGGNLTCDSSTDFDAWPDPPVWGDGFAVGFEAAYNPAPPYRIVTEMWAPDPLNQPRPGSPFPIIYFGPQVQPVIPEVVDPFYMPIQQAYANMIQPAYRDLPALAKAQNELAAIRVEGSVNGYGAPPVKPPPEPPLPRRVGPKEKDVKWRGGAATSRFAGGITELNEFFQDLWAALPPGARSFVPGTQLPGGRPQYVRRRLYPTLQQMAADVYTYARSIDVNAALANVAYDQIMDYVYGKQASKIRKNAKAFGFSGSFNLSRLAGIP